MSALSTRSVLPAVLLASHVVFGCGGDPDPCWDVEVGDELLVEVRDSYDEGSQFAFSSPVTFGAEDPPSCNSGFDFSPGDATTLRLTGQYQTNMADCMPGEAEADGAGSGLVTLVEGSAPRAGFSYGPAPVSAIARGRVGECEGGWQLDFLDHGSGGRFSEPEPGAIPPVVMIRGFGPGASAACEAIFGNPLPRYCADMFVVKLGKL
jgi:hypothetical protein